MTLCIHFVRGLVVVSMLLGAACLPLRAARSQAGGEARAVIGSGDELLPTDDAAYDAIQRLAQQGLFTGFPDGSFSGKRPMSHDQFATAIRSLAVSATRGFEVGASWRPHASLPEGWSALQREAERIDSRATAEDLPLDDCLRVLEAAWRDAEPHGVRVPFLRDPQLPGRPVTPANARLQFHRTDRNRFQRLGIP